MTIGSWTNGELSIEHVVREGNMSESFIIKGAPTTPRQRGKGTFRPYNVVLLFALQGEAWMCTGALVEGPILRKDGTDCGQWHKARWLDFTGDEGADTPRWLVDLAMRRLAHIKYVPNKAPDDGTWP